MKFYNKQLEKEDVEYLIKNSDNLNTGKLIKTIGREKEKLEILVHMNRKFTNNILLVGNHGVGKTHLVKSLASSENMDFLSINTSCLLGNTRYRGEFEDKVNTIFQILLKYKINCFIDEVHTTINAGGVEGGIKLNDILKPIIENKNIVLIGATTYEEYKFFDKDKAFTRRFHVIEIKRI